MGLLSIGNIQGSPFELVPQPSNEPIVYPFNVYLTNTPYDKPDVRIGLFLTGRYDGIVIAGEDVNMTVTAILDSSDPLINNASVIGFAIQNAFVAKGFQDFTEGIPNAFWLGLQRTKGTNVFHTDGFPIYFSTQGSFHPIVIVQGLNYSSGVRIIPDVNIDVEPRAVLHEFEFNQTERAFTYALVIFAFFEGLALLSELYKGSTIEVKRN